MLYGAAIAPPSPRRTYSRISSASLAVSTSCPASSAAIANSPPDARLTFASFASCFSSAAAARMPRSMSRTDASACVVSARLSVENSPAAPMFAAWSSTSSVLKLMFSPLPFTCTLLPASDIVYIMPRTRFSLASFISRRAATMSISDTSAPSIVIPFSIFAPARTASSSVVYCCRAQPHSANTTIISPAANALFMLPPKMPIFKLISLLVLAQAALQNARKYNQFAFLRFAACNANGYKLQ